MDNFDVENGHKKHRRLSDRLTVKKKTRVKEFSPNDGGSRRRSKCKVHWLDSENAATKQAGAVRRDEGVCIEKLPGASKQLEFSGVFNALPPLREMIRERERGNTLAEASGTGAFETLETQDYGRTSVRSLPQEAGAKGQTAEESSIHERSKTKEKTKGKRKERRGILGAAPRMKTPDRDTRPSGTFGQEIPRISTENDGTKVSAECLHCRTSKGNSQVLEGTLTGEQEGYEQSSTTTDAAKMRNHKDRAKCCSPISTALDSLAGTSNSRLSGMYLNSPRVSTCQATPSSKFPWQSPVFAVSNTTRLPCGPKVETALHGKSASKPEKSVTVLYSEEELELMGSIVQQFASWTSLRTGVRAPLCLSVKSTKTWRRASKCVARCVTAS